MTTEPSAETPQAPDPHAPTGSDPKTHREVLLDLGPSRGASMQPYAVPVAEFGRAIMVSGARWEHIGEAPDGRWIYAHTP